MDLKVEFERLQPYIEAALAHDGGHSIDDVRKGIEDGNYVFWPGANSAIVTEILDEPQRRTLHFYLAGGNLPELEAMYPIIEEWGRERGCTRVSTLGRPGWTRSFLTRRHGWHQSAVLLEKSL